MVKKGGAYGNPKNIYNCKKSICIKKNKKKRSSRDGNILLNQVMHPAEYLTRW
jgi:hypothetical protein